VRSRAARAVVFLIAIAAAFALSARAADAHPYLVRAEPAPGSALSAAPKQLQLLFTERLDGPYCTVTVVGTDGHRYPASVHVTGSALQAEVNADLRDGAYRVEWSVIGDDGHRVEGDYGLAVGKGATATAGVSTVSGRASDQVPGGTVTRIALVALDMALAALVLASAFFLPRSQDENRRSASILIPRTVWVAAVGVAALVVVQLWVTQSAFGSTVTGRLALQRLVATLAVFPVALGLIRHRRLNQAYTAIATLGLLVSVALASHAFAASTGRIAQVAVLTVHLVAASVWLAALVALLAGTPARRLLAPVVVAIAVVIGTGVFNAHVQLGSAGELLHSAYGRVLDLKVALVVVMIAAGLAATAAHRSWRRKERNTHISAPRTRRRAEVYAAVGVVLLAAVLGQLPNPVAIPLFSQRHPQPVGSTVTTTSTGNTLLAVALSPARAGLNRLVVSVERPDDNDVPLPVMGVGAIDVSATCACGAPPVSGHLTPVDGGPALAGSLLFPKTGRWSLRLAAPDGPADADVDVSGPPVKDDVVVGVPADLSGPNADACQDQVLGLQVAAAEVNERGVAGGHAVRVVAVDNHGPDPSASVGALRSLGARVLAMPCGPPDATAGIQKAAASAGIPVVGGDSGGTNSAWAWPTLAAPEIEGNALAHQLERQGGRRPLLVLGNGEREHAVAAAAAAAFDHDGLPVRSLPLADPAATATQIRQDNPDAVLFALSANEAPPLLQALAAVRGDWGPEHGAVATSSMMSATVVTTGGSWFKDGRVSLASEVNPADGTALDYATRLQQLAPGRHPSVDGVRGYVAGWLIANVLHRAPDPTPSQVRDQFAHDLRSFVIGPTRLGWNAKTSASQGGAETVAFFQTVFTNPLALSGLPGTVGHSGVFLGQGSFVQVTPWSTP